MNWLAQVFLSQKDIEHQLEICSQTHLKPKLEMVQAKLFHRGIKNHLQIDAFTESPAIVSHLKKSLTPRGCGIGHTV